ncbi:phage-related baseplate assembly protein J [Escherichia coli]|nr:phage-related baseplate assembly protein J [Escherichia coli]
MLVRVAVQEAAKQNLVAFAREPMIDYLGELVGVYRLAAQPATTTLQFSVDEALAIDVLIPAGTRVQRFRQRYFCHRYRCGTEGRIGCWSMSRPPVPNPVPLVTAGNLRRSVSYSMRLITLTCW